MKTLYFDCFSGISGDMTIGALLDVGVDFGYLKSEIAKLPVDGFDLRLTRVVRASISSAKFDVIVEGESSTHSDAQTHTHDMVHTHGDDHGDDHEDAHGDDHEDAHGDDHEDAHGDDHGHDHASSHEHPEQHETKAEHEGHFGEHFHRKASQIMDMIRQSPLGPGVKKRAVDIFEKLAISEGQVHGMPPEEVEFHEVGAIDSIVDVVGAAIGLEALEVEQFVCSPINIGGGFIHCQHGVYPVPAPATANLLTAAQVYSRHVDKELVTPTGAAILAATVDRFGPMDGFTIDRVGYGAGSADLGNFPNCLRLFTGDEVRPESFTGSDQVFVGRDKPPVGRDKVIEIEANIDDMSAEQLSYASDKLMSSGALDVVVIPVLMKKGRPGHMLKVLCEPSNSDRMSRVMFEETTTIGVRMRPADRQVLEREVVRVDTGAGPIRIKVSRLEGRVLTVSPEYDDCARVAGETNRPFHEVRERAVQSYRDSISKG